MARIAIVVLQLFALVAFNACFAADVSPSCQQATVTSTGKCACVVFEQSAPQSQCTGVDEDTPVPSAYQTLINGLYSPDPAVADAAYTGLYNAGTAAISALWVVANDATAMGLTFAGDDEINPEGNAATEPPTVAEIALILIDAIILGNPQPYSDISLSYFDPSAGSSGSTSEQSNGNYTDSELFAEALAWYGDWLVDYESGAANGSTALSDYRATPALPRLPPTGYDCPSVPRPTSFANITQPVVSFGFFSFSSGGSFNFDFFNTSSSNPVSHIAVNPSFFSGKQAVVPWTQVPGSQTPWGPGNPKIDPLRPWNYIYNPAVPRPYNCIAYAMGHTDGWYWPGSYFLNFCFPNFGVIGRFAAMLQADGYNPLSPCACPGPCPPGTNGPKIIMLFRIRLLTCTAELVHGMRKDAATWSSKNGQSFLYTGIPDASVNAFLQQHYPQINFGLCFCKPNKAPA